MLSLESFYAIVGVTLIASQEKQIYNILYILKHSYIIYYILYYRSILPNILLCRDILLMSCQCTNADVKSLDQQTNEICLLSAGFKVVTDVITSKKKRDLMWVVGLITFFMSAVLDNLTTTIVMVSLVKKVSTMFCFFLHSNVYLFAFYFHIIFIL